MSLPLPVYNPPVKEVLREKIKRMQRQLNDYERTVEALPDEFLAPEWNPGLWRALDSFKIE